MVTSIRKHTLENDRILNPDFKVKGKTILPRQF